MSETAIQMSEEVIQMSEEEVQSSEELVQMSEKAIQMSEEVVQMSEAAIQMSEAAIQMSEAAIQLSEWFFGPHPIPPLVRGGRYNVKFKVVIGWVGQGERHCLRKKRSHSNEKVRYLSKNLSYHYIWI